MRQRADSPAGPVPNFGNRAAFPAAPRTWPFVWAASQIGWPAAWFYTHLLHNVITGPGWPTWPGGKARRVHHRTGGVGTGNK